MKKYALIIIFTLGLGIFFYPIISNIFATTAHQEVIKEYRNDVKHLNQVTLKKEKAKVDKHNESLAESDLNFVDPFAEEKAEEKVGTKSYYDALDIGLSIATVIIPKINVELPIYRGTSNDVLSRGAGHLENSSLPSSKSGIHSVITAHRGLPSSTLFRHLDKLDIGDQFFVEVLDEIIAYEVDSIDVVLPSETEWLTMPENGNLMTLLTCDPYMVNSHRMLVTGHRVPFELEELPEPEINNTKYYIIVGVFLLLIIMILGIRHYMRKGERL